MQASFFDLENRYLSLSTLGDPLERLNAAIDWEIFRADLDRMDQKLRNHCRALMFKLLILRRLHGLSDERLEYQVRGRLSFVRLLGLELSGKVPAALTVWAFRELLKEYQLAEALFERRPQTFAGLGVQLKSGQPYQLRNFSRSILI